MLLAVSADKTLIIVIIAVVLVIHYFLAVAAVRRLFSFKPPFGKDFVWHIVIQLLLIIGPAFFLIICKKNKPRDFNIPFVRKQSGDTVTPDCQATIENIQDGVANSTDKTDNNNLDNNNLDNK